MEQQQTEHSSLVSPDELEAMRQELLEIEKSDPSYFQSILSDVVGGVAELPGQIARGAAEAVNETTDAAYGLAKWVNDNVMDLGHLRMGAEATGGVGIQGVVQWHPGMGDQKPARFEDANLPAQPQTVTGGIINDVTQFAVGFLTAGRALKAFGVAAPTTAAGVAGQALAKGAASDAVVFDPHEERLSNLVQKYPSLQNPVTEFLAADPTDSEAMGRFKNAVEGMGLGVVAEGVVHGVKAISHYRRGDVTGAKATLDEMEGKAPEPDEPLKVPPEGEQLDLGLEGGGPGKDSPRETVEPNPTAEVPPLKPTKDNAEFKPVKKLVEMDEEGLRDTISARIAEDGFGQGRNLSGIRTDLIENGDDINSIMSSLRVVYREEMDKAIGGNADNVRTWDAVKRNVERLADIVGDDPRIMMQRMSAMQGNLKHLDAETRLYEDFLATVADKVYKLSDLVADPLGGLGPYKTRAELMTDFAKHYELLANVQGMYKGIQTNIARSMNAFKIGAKVNPELLRGVNPDDLFQGGVRNMEALARRVKATGGNTKALVRTSQGGFVKNFLGSVNEYWINSILSGVKTHVVNMGSSAINTAFQPAEKMMAGALRAGTEAGRHDFIEGGLQYVGLVASLRDAVTLSARALKMGDNVLDPLAPQFDTRQVIGSQTYGITNPAVAMTVDGLGTLIRLPSRFLTAEDEFFKQLNYRAEVRAQAYREGITNGLLKDPKAFAAYVEDALDAAVDGTSGRALDARRLENAREATFTNDLRASTWGSRRTMGETLQQASDGHPLVRMVLPFVRTPTNIMRYVWNRTPGLNLLRKQYVDDLMGRNGDAAAGKAFAQMTTGAALWTTAVSYVADGDITGHGPRDPEIRKQLMATGWRPYSVRTQNEDGSVTYRSYDRADPFGMFFSLAADYAEVMNSHPEQTREEMATGMAVALAKNLNSKSYLSGVVNALGAFAEPERQGAKFVQRFAGSFVPNLLNQQFKDDPYMREVRSVLDAIHARTPGYSDTLDPVRNILGEKVHVPAAWGPEWLSPIAQGVHLGGDQPMTEEWKHRVNTDVHDELARQMFIHGSKILTPPKSKGEVDFTEFRRPDLRYSAYDRYQELTGAVTIRGKTLRQSLEDLIGSRMYQEKLTDGDFHYDGSRGDAIKAVVGGYRQVAEAQLRKEFPELDYALRQEALKAAHWKVKPKDQRQ